MEKEKISEILKNEFGMSIPKDMTSEETGTWIHILKNLGVDIENKEQCQALLDKYNKEKNKNIDVAKVMKTPVEELKLSTRTYNCLKKAGFDKVLDIIEYNQLMRVRVRNFGEKKHTELKQKLLEYEIDIDDILQCQSLIDEYNKQKSKSTVNKITELETDNMKDNKEKNIDTVEILNMTIEDLDLSIGVFNCVKRAGINTVYDILKHQELEKIRNFGSKRFEELKQKFLGYGINLDDRVQCEELMNQYNNREIEKKETEISECKKEHEFKESNGILEKKLESKQATLRGLKKQLERREYLEKQLLECDKEFNRLVEQYNSLNSKESSNNHGTK